MIMRLLARRGAGCALLRPFAPTGRRAHAVQVDESLTDLAALAEVLECDGQALLALPPKPLVVEPLDGVVERRQLVAATIRDVQRVINGLGPVSA